MPKYAMKWPRMSWYNRHVNNTKSPKTGTPAAADPITTEPIIMANYIDWKNPSVPKIGRWPMSPGHVALIHVIAARFNVTATCTGDAKYHRAFTFTGQRADIDAALLEYDDVQPAIMYHGKFTYDTAASDTDGATDIGAYVNGRMVSWQSFHNAWMAGAASAYATLHGVTATIAPRDPYIGAYAATMFEPEPEPEPATAPKRKRANRATKPANVDAANDANVDAAS